MTFEPAADLLADARWKCTSTPPGRYAEPSELSASDEPWWPAEVPGTAASAVCLAGRACPQGSEFDALDWWFSTSVTTPDGTFDLAFEGLATVADVWLDERHLLRSENMFRRFACRCQLVAGVHRIVIRCAALDSALEVRRPRPRWKTPWAREQSLRWFRTAMQGRLGALGNLAADVPPIVGPWRPVTLRAAATRSVQDVELRATAEGEGGAIAVRFRISAGTTDQRIPLLTDAVVSAGGVEAPLSVELDGDDFVVRGRLALPRVDRWWPHTHGSPVLYEVTARIGSQRLRLGRVGFRTLRVETADGAFVVSVNDVPIFCRGAVWYPPDPLRPHTEPARLRATLGLLRDANGNMVRVPGAGLYEDHRFFELCDEMGLLIWHDCMFAFMDPPQDPSFEREVELELREVFTAMSGHPSVAVVCGGQEIDEIAAMNGLSPDRRHVELVEKHIPRLVEELLPNVAYVSQNPTGGDVPFRTDSGVSHYFGVGGYMRPLSDARLANVRFATECLGFAIPPEPATVTRRFGGAKAAGHAPCWKETVHRDPFGSYDFDDVRDYYVERIFGLDARQQRRDDPERALDLGRATVAAVMAQVFSEWRRPGSSCAGALVLALSDQLAGAGWGLVDVDGIPKAPWYALRRILDPVAVLVTDEGLNGLHCHLVNDTAEPFRGTVAVELYARGQALVEAAEHEVLVPARSAQTFGAEALLGGFRDVTYSYHFGPPAHDVVAVTLLGEDGQVRSQAVHLPLGHGRAREASVGLHAEVGWDRHGRPSLEVFSERFAQWVVIEVPGFRAEDSWFQLPPRQRRTVLLSPVGAEPVHGPVRGRVRALNTYEEIPVLLEMRSP